MYKKDKKNPWTVLYLKKCLFTSNPDYTEVIWTPGLMIFNEDEIVSSWKWQLILTGHEFGRTKQFAATLLDISTWLVTCNWWLKLAMIPWRSCMTIVTRETSVETFIEITMFRTASFQICDRHPIIYNIKSIRGTKLEKMTKTCLCIINELS